MILDVEDNTAIEEANHAFKLFGLVMLYAAAVGRYYYLNPNDFGCTGLHRAIEEACHGCELIGLVALN